ncbi:MAG: hypothetical protein AAF926_08835 [Pseudomonadota bacterium]
MRIDIATALPTLEASPAGPLHTSRRFRALRSGGFYGPRIDIIADAVDHLISIAQMRMIVNNSPADFP